MNSLALRLRRMIEAQGPISLATYMGLCLGDRRQGYYATRDPLGAAGDFVTAPEISQIFGELIGLTLAGAWLELGAPPRVLLVEAGPGRGTLMADLMRAARAVPGFAAAAELHLIETNPVLTEVQSRVLGELQPRWHGELAGLPQAAPILLAANEFLDALPIRQLFAVPGGWRERCVGVDAEGELGFVPGGPLLPSTAVAAAPGCHLVELGPAREAWVAELARRLAQQGGMAMLIDYGGLQVAGDTLQAVCAHRPAAPLTSPGEVDLSAHVDFGALARAAARADVSVFGPLPQGAWLRRLGIELRLERLTAGVAPAVAETLSGGVRRLVEPAAMGELFKVLALVGRSRLLPAGFTAEDAWPQPS